MSNQLSTRNANARFMLVGTLILLLAASFPLAAAAGSSEASFSGDDAYDPAAGGVSASFSFVTASPNALAAFEESGPTYSGDDAYDPAASDLSAAFLLAAESDDCDDASGIALIGSFSGDDAYDPAAGGIPNSSVIGAVCV